MQRHVFPNVLIFGAGGIGLLCSMVARLLGAAKTIVADTNDERLAIARQTGVDVTVNPSKTDIGVLIQQELGEKGIDVVIDAAGFQPTREAALKWVNPGGTVMNIGLGIDQTELRINHLIRNEIEILGSFCYSADDFHDAVALLTSGRITEQGWTEIRPMSEGEQAFAELVAGRVTNGKIFLRPDAGNAE
jgi:threonine dehydrogenase-like Zn-dependent dehydrogenase